MGESEERLHIVVPCMGRLDLLQQSIGDVIGMPRTTYTLVDYSSPERVGEWVKEHYPEANVVHVQGRQRWHAAEAMNIGARAAPEGWLCMLNADVVPHPQFAKLVLGVARPGAYIALRGFPSGVAGTLICRKEDLLGCGGYDEVMQGWGFEDIDVRLSLDRSGLDHIPLPAWTVRHIDHDDALRTSHTDIKDKWLSNRINEEYARRKYALLDAGFTPSPQALRGLYATIRSRILPEEGG